MISADERSKSPVSPIPSTDQATIEPTVVEVPVATVTTTNPLAKLISTMLPNATPFMPGSNGTTNRPVSPVPLATSTMNNDAVPFIPSQPQHGSGQHHLNNANAGHWNNGGARGGGGNRRGQSGVSFYSCRKQSEFTICSRVVVFIMVVEEINALQVCCSSLTYFPRFCL